MKNEAYHSELRALLSIRNFNSALEKHYSQMLEIEEKLEEFHKSALAIIEAHSSTKSQEKWKNGLKEMNSSLKAINEVLNSAKEKVKNHDRSDSLALWKQFKLHLDNLKVGNKNLEDLGFEILPESEHIHWRKDVCNFEDTILPLIVSHAKACKTELQMIEKYTPKEIDNVTQIILDHVPEDFNFEEADKYEKDYRLAFEDFKKEFSPEKNLWDTLLDIVAGGTHQPPSERVMMKRWLEGEKGDL
jgi:gas vesicle protein